MATKVYESIVFMDGDDYTQAMYEVGAYDKESPAVIRRWAEQWDGLYNYLLQWEYGEPCEEHGTPPWGSSDDTQEYDDGRYVVSWNARLGYCSLTRVTERVSADA